MVLQCFNFFLGIDIYRWCSCIEASTCSFSCNYRHPFWLHSVALFFPWLLAWSTCLQKARKRCHRWLLWKLSQPLWDRLVNLGWCLEYQLPAIWRSREATNNSGSHWLFSRAQRWVMDPLKSKLLDFRKVFGREALCYSGKFPCSTFGT